MLDHPGARGLGALPLSLTIYIAKYEATWSGRRGLPSLRPRIPRNPETFTPTLSMKHTLIPAAVSVDLMIAATQTTLLLRGGISSRIYGTHKNLEILLVH